MQQTCRLSADIFWANDRLNIEGLTFEQQCTLTQLEAMSLTVKRQLVIGDQDHCDIQSLVQMVITKLTFAFEWTATWSQFHCLQTQNYYSRGVVF